MWELGIHIVPKGLGDLLYIWVSDVFLKGLRKGSFSVHCRKGLDNFNFQQDRLSAELDGFKFEKNTFALFSELVSIYEDKWHLYQNS